MGSDRRDLLRECLIEWNLEFDIPYPSLFTSFFNSYQVCLANETDRIEFIRLEELSSPSVMRNPLKEQGFNW